MNLVPVILDINDPTGANNTTNIRNAMATVDWVANNGIQLPSGGPYRVKSVGGNVLDVNTNNSIITVIAGANVAVEQSPNTWLLVYSTDSADGGFSSMFGQYGSQLNLGGVEIRDLKLDGGRVNGNGGSWGTRQGSCINMAGQGSGNSWANGTNVFLNNLEIFDGLAQQTSFNSVNGFTFYRVKAYRTYGTGPTTGSHGCDFDAVAYDKPSANGKIIDSDLYSYGQEAFKLENCRDFLFSNTILRQYHGFVQDDLDMYSELANINFYRCTFDAPTYASFMTRAHVNGAAYTKKSPTNVHVTLTGTNQVGATVTSPGSGGTAGEYVFTSGNVATGGDVGAMIGWLSPPSPNAGCVQINTVFANGGISGTIVDVFSTALTFPNTSPTNTTWMVAPTNTGGNGMVTFTQCKFTANAGLHGGPTYQINYGPLKFIDCVFDEFGNGFQAFGPNVAITTSGNINDNLPRKHFVRPGLDPSLIQPLSNYCARGYATTDINAAVTAASNGDVVFVLNGRYVSTSGGVNRSIGCGGKVITIRAETELGALIDGSNVSGPNIIISNDPLGSLIWGFQIYGAGVSGGNGIGLNITGGQVTVRKVYIFKCKTNNNGAGIKVANTGAISILAPTIEDFIVEDCDGGSTATNLIGNGNSTVGLGTPILKRGIFRRNTANGSGVVRLDAFDGAYLENVEIVDNTNTNGIAGINATQNCTLINVTCANNKSSNNNAFDISVSNGKRLSGNSCIFWSHFPENTGSNTINLTAGSGTMSTFQKVTIRPGAANGASISGAVGNAPATTEISNTDPQFADTLGGNYQLAANSVARGNGAVNSWTWDFFNRPNLANNKGAWFS